MTSAQHDVRRSNRRPIELALIVAASAALATFSVWWLQGPPLQNRQAPTPFTVLRGIEYHPGVELDVLEPVGTGPWPVVVLLHGCCGGREDMFQLGHDLASEGALVFNAGWQTIPTGGRFPEVYDQAACAIRFARAHAGEYGGESGDVTLVGWSDGALIGSIVAMSGDDEWLGDCAESGTPRPDRFVGIAGFYGWSNAELDALATDDGAVSFFGGDPVSERSAWEAGNPRNVVERGHALRASLVVGEEDDLLEDSQCFHEALLARGMESTLTVVEETDHLEVLSPRLPGGGVVVAIVLGRETPDSMNLEALQLESCL